MWGQGWATGEELLQQGNWKQSRSVCKYFIIFISYDGNISNNNNKKTSSCKWSFLRSYSWFFFVTVWSALHFLEAWKELMFWVTHRRRSGDTDPPDSTHISVSHTYTHTHKLLLSECGIILVKTWHIDVCNFTALGSAICSTFFFVCLFLARESKDFISKSQTHNFIMFTDAFNQS